MLSVIIAGRIVALTGRYWYFLVLGPVPGAIGAGLLYTTTPDTSNAKLIGYQILCGIGVGTAMQNSLFAMQATFKDNMRLVGQATGMASFAQFLGASLPLFRRDFEHQSTDLAFRRNQVAPLRSRLASLRCRRS